LRTYRDQLKESLSPEPDVGGPNAVEVRRLCEKNFNNLKYI